MRGREKIGGGKGDLSRKVPLPPPNLPLSPPKIFVWVNGVRGGVAACFGGARLPVSRQRGRGKRGREKIGGGKGNLSRKVPLSPSKPPPFLSKDFCMGQRRAGRRGGLFRRRTSPGFRVKEEEGREVREKIGEGKGNLSRKVPLPPSKPPPFPSKDFCMGQWRAWRRGGLFRRRPSPGCAAKERGRWRAESRGKKGGEGEKKGRGRKKARKEKGE